MNLETLVFSITLVAAAGCGLLAGVFFAFSVSVMRALARLPAGQGIVVMQTINVVILNPVFLGTFLGTAAACALAMVLATITGHAGVLWIDAGGALYLIGAFAVTMRVNVPKNQALADLAPDDPASALTWSRYLVEWTAWNHLRGVASLAASVLLMIGL